MSRGELMERCRSHGLTNPERLTQGMTDELVASTLDWYEHDKFTLGRKVDKGLLAWGFQEGGMEFEAPSANGQPRPAKPWYTNAAKRAEWADDHFPDEPDEAEAAVISLANAKKEITVESVRKTIGWERQEDADFYAGGAFETKLAPPSGGDSKSVWVSYAARKSS